MAADIAAADDRGLKRLCQYRTYRGSMSTNAARMHSNRIEVLTKHFGPPSPDVAAWAEEKKISLWLCVSNQRAGLFEPEGGSSRLGMAGEGVDRVAEDAGNGGSLF